MFLSPLIEKLVHQLGNINQDVSKISKCSYNVFYNLIVIKKPTNSSIVPNKEFKKIVKQLDTTIIYVRGQ